MRISGLASGFDTDEMVKQLMQVERIKVDRVEQNKQTMIWKQKQYNSINKQFANFILNSQKDIGLRKTSSTGSLFGNSYKNLDYVKKATSSNDTVATVSNTGKTSNGSFDLKVETIPRNANFTSAEIENFNSEGSTEMVLKINGNEINVSGKKIKEGETEKIEAITIDDVVKAINTAKNETSGKSIGVTAFYDEGTKRMFLQSSVGTLDDDGKFELNITGIGSAGEGFVSKMKTLDEKDVDGKVIKIGVKTEYGIKGQVTINGLPVDASGGKVEFNGLTIDIKAEGTTRINVSTNTEGIMEKIEKLVADYNDLVDLSSGLVNEKVYSGYKPLSSEERKALSEEDLKLWDEKAKSGLLNRDETLERTLQTIRMDLYKTLEGASGSFNHITQIGISTEKYAKGSAGGKLQIDTDKLRKAIEEDAEGVMELLFKESESIEGKPIKEKYDDEEVYKQDLKDYNRRNLINRNKSSGIFTRVYDGLIDGMKAIINKSGAGEDELLYRNIKSNMLLDFVTTKGSISDLDKSVNEMNRQIDNLNILLAKKENAHYAKFTAMEKQMYKMQNQSSWITQQFM